MAGFMRSYRQCFTAQEIVYLPVMRMGFRRMTAQRMLVVIIPVRQMVVALVVIGHRNFMRMNNGLRQNNVQRKRHQQKKENDPRFHSLQDITPPLNGNAKKLP
ncbi:MAG: hypothetical protein PSY14_03515 [bacterium]|nr:hypothetical protein [bacterium]